VQRYSHVLQTSRPSALLFLLLRLPVGGTVLGAYHQIGSRSHEYTRQTRPRTPRARHDIRHPRPLFPRAAEHDPPDRHHHAGRAFLAGCSTVAVKRASRFPRPTPLVTAILQFTCKRNERRGWDSNPRDGSTPPTRFPIALLRPTRTPLQKRRTGVYQIAKLLLPPRSAWPTSASGPPPLRTQPSVRRRGPRRAGRRRRRGAGSGRRSR
jgi:hypothetical protein